LSGPSVAIPFVKASACGNDFLLIKGALAPADVGAFTRRICDRHEGVGADGVEWMFPHAPADVEIRLVNADGSAAEISGNGTRCVAAYICAERGLEKVSILTGAGLKVCALTARHESEYEFEMEMGAVEVWPESTISVGDKTMHGLPVTMGNPHYVVFVDEFAQDWKVLAARIQDSGQFKLGVNIEFVKVDSARDVSVRFFERGVGETQSSGTGSCAVAAAAMATGRAQSPVRVHAAGGTQSVRKDGSQIFLRGPAQMVCRGEFFLGR
jgi:diaminopimelate epimerase